MTIELSADATNTGLRPGEGGGSNGGELGSILNLCI